MAKNNKLKVAQFTKAWKPILPEDRFLVDINTPDFRSLVKGLALEAIHEACMNNLGLRGVMKRTLNG